MFLIWNDYNKDNFIRSKHLGILYKFAVYNRSRFYFGLIEVFSGI